jgi:hypothetical protein
MQKDRNIQIGFTINKKKNTISIKESVLNLYSITFFDKNYTDNKKSINKLIKNLIGKEIKNLEGISNKISKFLLSCVSEEIKRTKK